MADNPNPDLELPEAAAPAEKPKKKGVKRRIFLIGSALVVGGGLFGVWSTDSSAKAKAKALTVGEGEHGFQTWMKIAEDDTVTVFSPHIDFGQGSQTALGQMLADELDAAWDNVKIEQAPADLAFANVALAKGFLPSMAGETLAGLLPDAVLGIMARSMPLMITGGSSAIRFTGELAMRKTGAAVRMALIEEAGVLHGYLEDQLFIPALVRGRALAWGRGAAATGRPYLARSAEEHSGPHTPWFWQGAQQGGGVDHTCIKVIARSISDAAIHG
jgi:isoquinoline 1-oxidoreductase beta subunit